MTDKESKTIRESMHPFDFLGCKDWYLPLKHDILRALNVSSWTSNLNTTNYIYLVTRISTINVKNLRAYGRREDIYKKQGGGNRIIYES